jgi:hypothetical protein
VDLEIALARALGWSLYDIDRTDVSSLVPFVLRLLERNEIQPGTGQPRKTGKPKVHRVYCDQVNL